MQLHNMLHNSQPESGTPLVTGSGLIHPVKAFKYSRQVFKRNADTGVRYRNPDELSRIFRNQADDAAIGSVLDGVLQQIDYYLFQSALVCHDTRQLTANGFID